MPDAPRPETSQSLSIEELAAQMLGLANQEEPVNEPEQPQAVQQQGHPAWQSILDAVPAEYHEKLVPTLQEWDTGVSRRFQKIHDEYAPLKELKNYDPNAIEEAMNIFNALNNDPASTWEAIGRAYGLSPQQHSQAESSEIDEDDFDLSDLPPAVRNRLARLDVHEEVLEAITQQLLSQQASDEEAAEDAALEEVLAELKETRGEFDEDYVIGLMAAGVDPEDAVERYQSMVARFTGGAKAPTAPVAPVVQQQSAPTPQDNLRAFYEQRQAMPRVMSSGGGVPTTGNPDVTKLSSQDTKNLVAELLRLTNKQ